MKLALSLALLCLFSAPRPATAIDRTRSTWQEGCQERQVQVLDKCQLSLFGEVLDEGVTLPLSGSAPQ
jgi:hypothetical protein